MVEINSDYLGFTTRDHNGYALVEFTTPSLMNATELERIGAALYRIIDEEKRRRIVLDFTKVQYVSSQAIGILMALRKKVAAHKEGELILCGLAPTLLQLMKITRLDKVLTIKPRLSDV